MTSVTILATVRNVRPTVESWLNSLLDQTYEPREIVIIDSNSTDGTQEILKNYSETYDRIKVIEYESTQPEALNFAIRENLVKSDLVALIDGDCVAPKEWLHTLVKTLKQNNYDAVGGPGLTPKSANFIQKLIGLDLDTRFLSTPEGFVYRHPNMNLLIKKSILKQIPFSEELHVGYDTDFGYRLKKNGYKIYFKPSAYVWHYHRSSVKGYLKQQLKTGYFAVKVYFKNRDGLKGDNINPPTMILQPIALCVLCIFAVAYLLTSTMAYAILGVVPILLLFSVEMYRAFAVGKNPLVVLLVILYFVRLPMWILGAAWGMINDGVVRFRGALKVQNYI
jgi:cellulose synthase/poly-beta-1,6-N-acetylglucosamine synthase-like glycosyltransferase